MRKLTLLCAALTCFGLLAGCGGGSNNSNFTIFNETTNIFPGMPDTNANGIPEAARGASVAINLDLTDGLDCSPNTNPVTRAVLTFNTSNGSLSTTDRTFTGDSALCSVDSFANTWTVPSTPGTYALSVNVTVTRDNGRVDTDSLLRQVEVF